MPPESAARASRAIGAMFFSVFGAAWLAVWCLLAHGARAGIFALIAVGAIVIFWAALHQFRRNRNAHTAEADSPSAKKAGRIFNLVNATQWVLIFVAINVLTHVHHREWIFPAIIAIVGLHFLPLAAAFQYPRHYFTGAALILLAAVYPFASPAGPSSPVGCLGAGLILWGSAVGALRPELSINMGREDV